MTLDALHRVIQNRQSVYPRDFNEKPISREIVENILEQADRAPTHKLTEPWRFHVLHKEAKRLELSNFLATKYKELYAGEKFKQKKFDKLSNVGKQSACVIAICMQRDEEERLPEWEEIAATAMAVQNMWLSCTAYGIGCYWSSPGLIKHMDEFLDLSEGERCLGFLYMGYFDRKIPMSKRKPLKEKVKWIE